MFTVKVFVMFSIASVASVGATVPKKGPVLCDPNTGIGCLPSPDDCPEGCVCNRTDLEVEDIIETRPSEKMEFKLIKTVTNYGSAGVSAKLHEKVEHVFQGIMISATLFIACASVCVFSVCIYCCHMRKSDRKLREEVAALAKKLKIDVSKQPGPSRQPRDPKAESCNVIVQGTNIMCV